MSRIEDAGLFIDGKKIRGAGEPFPTVNPATGEPIASVLPATVAQVDEAVEAARRAGAEWAARTALERGRVLQRAARLLRERLEPLAELEVLDTGKPITEARTVDVPSAADALEFFGGIAGGLSGRHVDLGGAFAYTRREPLGVCAGIGAWNYPLQIAAWKAAPALAAGNTMVFKPSELTPLSALRLAEVLLEAGVPPGVFNVVQGAGEVGAALSRHPRVAKVSVTGSVPTGQKVMSGAAETLKHVTLELGGKSPLVLFDDAPLEQAIHGALLANFFTQGEVCSNGTRVFVHSKLYDRFVEALVPRVAAIRVGDPLDQATQMGALISRAHLDRVLSYVELGRREGAKLLCGGERPRWDGERRRLEGGFFVTPAVFADCRDEMTIVREEIFGPVLSLLRFDSEEEVIARANATEFGLGAGVFTRDLARAHRVVARLDAGTCWINHYNVTPVEIPFGGVKRSGLGRENGLEALEHYSRVKSVYVELRDLPPPF
jgi:betaine-aldehyde dehydrogenase